MSWICKYVDRVLSFLTFPLNIYNISICLLGIIVLIQCIAFMSLFCACNLCDRQSSYTVLCIARVCLISRLSGPRVEISFHALHLWIMYVYILWKNFPFILSTIIRMIDEGVHDAYKRLQAVYTLWIYKWMDIFCKIVYNSGCFYWYLPVQLVCIM